MYFDHLIPSIFSLISTYLPPHAMFQPDPRLCAVPPRDGQPGLRLHLGSGRGSTAHPDAAGRAPAEWGPGLARSDGAKAAVLRTGRWR